MNRIATVVVLILSVSLCSVSAESPEELRSEIEAGWQRAIAGYQGKSFEFKQETFRNLKGLKTTSLVDCSVDIVSNDCIRSKGKTTSERVDSSGLDRRKIPGPSELASLPMKTTKTEFAAVCNSSYFAIIDLENSPAVSVLEEGSAKWPVKDLQRCYPGLCFGSPGGFVATDLIWDDTSSAIPEGKHRVVSVEKNATSVVLNLVSGPGMVESTLQLDPSHHFAISKWELTRKWGAGSLTLRSIYNYSDQSFHPLKIEFEEVISGTVDDDSTRHIATECTALVPTTCTESDCFLTAFGLPEPVFTRKTSLSSLWIYGPLVILMALTFIAWRRMRK